MSETPFKDISKKVKTIMLDNKPLKVKPKVKDADAFILIKKDMTEKDAERISKVMENIIRRAHTPEELSDEDIETLVSSYYGKLLGELSVLFGFTTREEIDKQKKDFTSSLKTKAGN